jgi:hypothetical protein
MLSPSLALDTLTLVRGPTPILPTQLRETPFPKSARVCEFCDQCEFVFALKQPVCRFTFSDTSTHQLTALS